MNSIILKQVLNDQNQLFHNKEEFVARTIDKEFIKSKKISVITGVRRCGKSTLMKLLSKQFGNYCYFNFKDERLLDFKYTDFSSLLELFYEIYGDDLNVYFFDEIQNVFGWEKFVRRLFTEGKKVFVTGSNSKLLSSELASSLTGRYLKIDLYPFSFTEFLSFNKIENDFVISTANNANMKRYINEYIELGGFPEVVKSKNKNELSQLYQDVLVKDIIVRFKIKDTKSFRELAIYLLSNISSLYSYNNLSKMLNIKSVNTVKNYISFLEEAFLFISVPKYDYSLKKQISSNRKIYTIDTGIFNAVSFNFSSNRGKQLENIVLLELKRKGNEVYYYSGNNECDFISTYGNKIVSAIQVTEIISNQNKDREINGIVEAMDILNINKGIILTYDQFDEIKIGKYKIKVLPIWYWLIYRGNDF
jgi:hypothetical protein